MKSSEQYPEGTFELLLRFNTGERVGQSAVNWAVSALGEGYDSPSLRVLAGLDVDNQATTEEALQLVDATFQELGLKRPDLDTTARWYVCEVATAVVAGGLPPREAANKIHRLVMTPMDHPKDLMAWCYVWEGNAADCSRPLDESEWDREILKVAMQYASVALKRPQAKASHSIVGKIFRSLRPGRD